MKVFWACPFANASGRAMRSQASPVAGFPLLSLTRIRVFMRCVCKKEVFLTLSLGGGWAGKPENPTKKTLLLR